MVGRDREREGERQRVWERERVVRSINVAEIT